MTVGYIIELISVTCVACKSINKCPEANTHPCSGSARDLRLPISRAIHPANTPSFCALPPFRQSVTFSTMASLGEDLLVIVNKLQDLVFNTIGNDSLDLPQIVSE